MAIHRPDRQNPVNFKGAPLLPEEAIRRHGVLPEAQQAYTPFCNASVRSDIDHVGQLVPLHTFHQQSVHPVPSNKNVCSHYMRTTSSSQPISLRRAQVFSAVLKIGEFFSVSLFHSLFD